MSKINIKNEINSIISQLKILQEDLANLVKLMNEDNPKPEKNQKKKVKLVYNKHLALLFMLSYFFLTSLNIQY
jgi:uncharacterized protein YwgA